MNCMIKPVENEDELEIFLGLAEDIFPETELDLERDDLVFIAYYHDEAVGFMHFGENEKFFQIKGIGVLPEYRGKGIGKSLMEYGLDEIYGKPVYLRTETSNQAVNLYDRCGFFAQNFGGISVLVKKELS
ncbi:MAG: GNAT family N-acetyltransferase [Candidatus Micrarchaeia archaeon]